MKIIVGMHNVKEQKTSSNKVKNKKSIWSNNFESSSKLLALKKDCQQSFIIQLYWKDRTYNTLHEYSNQIFQPVCEELDSTGESGRVSLTRDGLSQESEVDQPTYRTAE